MIFYMPDLFLNTQPLYFLTCPTFNSKPIYNKSKNITFCKNKIKLAEKLDIYIKIVCSKYIRFFAEMYLYRTF